MSTRRYSNSFAGALAVSYCSRMVRSSSASGKNREVRNTTTGRLRCLCTDLAQALGHELAHPIDILRLWNEILGHPSGRLRTDGRQRQAERARAADVDKTIDACVQSCLEQNQRSRDVRVDEVLPGVSCDMRLVERGRMDDRLR